MILKVQPVSSLKGRVRLPASKSYSIRAFLAAACGGVSVLRFPSDCDDAKVALGAARSLGVKISRPGPGAWRLSAGGRPHLAGINVKESGTVLRLVLPLAALRGSKVRVTGEGTLKGRPNRHLLQALRSMGVHVRGTGPGESVPIRISGGAIRGGRIALDASVSSQFVSSLLMTCPLLEDDSVLALKGRQLVSSDYVAMTLQVLRRAGIRMTRRGERLFFIPGRQVYRGLGHFTVPSDYGLAAFLLAACALVPSAAVLTGHFDDALVQADGRILGFLRRMGVRFRRTKNALLIRGPFALKGGRFSLKDCPDLVPVMAVLALFARGTTRLCDIRHARVKESDRISDLRSELLKTGADVRETQTELIINPRPGYRSGVLLDPHQDHRLAMAFSVLGLKIGTKIRDIDCVRKSYPGFVRDIRALGAKVSRAKQGKILNKR
ncbi:MAG: 3-phosphoshikimate 1-carboxyvinyltransferase [Candidatus Omnitrophota bacterium]|nr:3-phosphoshikimate 1-carboxyvinyltransferase [Candidatus Omnitrophota bacterium]